MSASSACKGPTVPSAKWRHDLTSSTASSTSSSRVRSHTFQQAISTLQKFILLPHLPFHVSYDSRSSWQSFHECPRCFLTEHSCCALILKSSSISIVARVVLGAVPYGQLLASHHRTTVIMISFHCLNAPSTCTKQHSIMRQPFSTLFVLNGLKRLKWHVRTSPTMHASSCVYVRYGSHTTASSNVRIESSQQ